MVKKNGKSAPTDATIIFPNPVFGNLVIARQNRLEYKVYNCPSNNVNETLLHGKRPGRAVMISEKRDNREITRKLEAIARTVQENEVKKAHLSSSKEKKEVEKANIECFNSNFNAILCEIIRAKAEERLVKKVDEKRQDGSHYELYEINLDEKKVKDTNVDEDGPRQNEDYLRQGPETPRSLSSNQSFEWNLETVAYGNQHRKVSELVDKLLYEIYGGGDSIIGRRESEQLARSSRTSGNDDTDSSGNVFLQNYENRRSVLANKSTNDLRVLLGSLKSDIHQEGNRLIRQLKRREALIGRQEADSNMITALLQAHSEKRSEDTRMKFSVSPGPGESGFEQWHSAMKMVARLSGGIPQEFRKTLWLTLAEKHLTSRGVDWSQAERLCFNEWSNPDDEELGVQIVKDLHRTGCSLFCGASGQQNQAVLKRVLLGYARWNKVVGYCQGFNMLAALILQVMDRNEVDSVKVMIYLIEGVLPESYFANSLRGLSVDMAVFRDLLRVKLPSLSRHLEQLQNDSKDSGTSYEPPLTNVFTMQWFLTLFSNCLPQATVLRVWDLIFLEGNAILLQTALAIWNSLSDRIMMVESADEFYSIMGVLTREMLEFGTIDANNLIKDISVIILPELAEMRERYLYNITPWTQVARKGLRLFYAEDEVEDTDEEEDKVANIATAYGFFKSRKSDSSLSRPMSPSRGTCPSISEDREKIALDISALKKQYCKLRERQRQAHVIFNAAYEGVVNLGQASSTPSNNAAPTVNHLLQGKNAILSMKGKRPGPPPGSIPPSLRFKKPDRPKDSGETIHWKDEPKVKNRRSVVQSCSSDTILSEVSNTTQDSLSGTSSRKGSIVSSSSSSTELCDEEGDRLSDFDSDAGVENYSTNVADPQPSDKIPVSSTNKGVYLQRKITESICHTAESRLKKLNEGSNQEMFDAKVINLSRSQKPSPTTEFKGLNENSPEIPDDKVAEVFSPEGVDNALCVDDSLSSSASVSPIELDNSVEVTVPNDLDLAHTKCDTNVLSIREPKVRLDDLESKTELNELLDDADLLSVRHVSGSRSPQLETVNNHSEALFDLSRKLDEMRANSERNEIDNQHVGLSDVRDKHSVTFENNDTEIARSDSNSTDASQNEDEKLLGNNERMKDRRSSDLELLKILNENSEILNRIQRKSSASTLDEPKLWNKQRSLDICPGSYEAQNTKWYSSSVDFSSMKLGSFNSKLSFETIDESKELRSSLDEDVDSNNSSNKTINHDTSLALQNEFGIEKIAEEGEANGIQNTTAKPKAETYKKYKKTFNPFPSKITTRQNKELAIKLGLYSPTDCNKSGKKS